MQLEKLFGLKEHFKKELKIEEQFKPTTIFLVITKVLWNWWRIRKNYKQIWITTSFHKGESWTRTLVEVGSVPTSEEEAGKSLDKNHLAWAKIWSLENSLVGVTSLSQLKIEPIQHLGTNI